MNINRREILKGAAGLGLVGVAGCLGGEEEGDIDAGCSSTGSTSFQACQAIQSAADEYLEDVSFNTTAPGGDPASIRQLDQGEVDANTAGNFIMHAAANDQEPFNEDPVETLGHTGFTFLTIYMYFVAVEGSDVESLDQAIEEERNIWAFPPEWGLRRLFRTNMEEAGRWSDIEDLLVGISAEDVAGAIDEERVECFTAYGSNLVSLPGWLVEVDSRTECYAIDVGDWYWDGVNASPAGEQEIEPFGWDQDLGTDSLQSWTEDFNLYFHPDVAADPVSQLLDLSHNRWEEMRDALPAYPDHSDPEAMTIGFWDNPVHEGAAEWLREQDAWDDSWTDGSEA